MTTFEPINTDPPYSVSLHHCDDETADASFRSQARSLWLKLLFIPLGILWVFAVVGAIVSLSSGVPLLTLILVAFCAAFFFLLNRIFFVTVHICVTPESVKVYEAVYDRQYWGGFCLLEGSTLGFNYGGKTESTGFSLPSGKLSYKKTVNPAEVVVWLNHLVDSIRLPRRVETSSGVREQKF